MCLYLLSPLSRPLPFPLLFLILSLTLEYSCAWHRDGSLLIQGHMYITANYVCFYSSILGWETKVRGKGGREREREGEGERERERENSTCITLYM